MMLLKIAVSVGLLSALLLRLDMDSLAQRLGAADGSWLLATAAVFVLELLAASLRWQLAIAALSVHVALPRVTALTFAGSLFNQVLVSSIGGDVVKAWLLHREKSRLSTVVLSLVIDRLLGVLGLGIVVAVAMALPVADRLGGGTRASVLLAGLALAAGLGGLLWFAFRRPGDGAGTGMRMRRLREVAEELRGALRLMLLKPRLALSATGLAVFIHLLSVLAAWCAAQAIGADVGPQALLVCVPLALLAATAPISIGGWGIREGALVALLHLYGTPPDAALALSIVFGLSLLAASLPGLAFWLAWRQERQQAGDGLAGPAER